MARQRFSSFYREYLADHDRPMTRAWHVAGTVGFISAVVLAFVWQWWFLLAGVAFAYALAWLSHLFIEGNRPRTFRNPLYSLLGDFRMTFEILTGRRPLGERSVTPREYN